MLTLHLISFGKLKTPGLRDTADYYLKLLRPWVRVEEHELKPAAVHEKTDAARRIVQDREAELWDRTVNSLRKNTPPRIYLLDEKGTDWTTLRWSEEVRTLEASSGTNALFFGVGSSLGFSKKIKESAHARLSFGAQTISHELARVILLEQLFRSWSVTRGHPYHNEGG